MIYILGVDPGLSGALVLVDPKTSAIGPWIKTPAVKRGSRSDIDLEALAHFLETTALSIKYAVVEDVAAAPKQGVTGMFTFGKVTGIVVGMIAAHHIPIFYVKPSVWKFQMGLTKDKAKSLLKVKKLLNFETRHDGLAEAALMAHFGKRFLDV